MVLGLAVLFSVMPSARAQNEERTTASEVVDRDTLKAFVLGARDYISNITDIDELVALADVLRNEEWKHENTYLIILELNGIVRFHGAGLALTGKAHRKGATLLELADMFPTEESAVAWMEAAAWGEERCCGHC